MTSRRNCWTCGWNSPDDSCHNHASGEEGAAVEAWLAKSEWIGAMPADGSDNCPGWRAKDGESDVDVR